MNTDSIVAQLNEEIQKLTSARDALLGTAQRGRPKGSTNAPKKVKKNRMSPEGRKRIADAMRARWADKRAKGAPKPTKAAKKAAGKK